MTTDTDKASDKLVEMALKAAFEKGWCAAAQWAQRDDLRHDTGSIAYAGQRDAILAGKAAEVRSAILADAAKDVEPVAWGIFAKNGNIRFWACDKSSADSQAAKTGGDVVGIVPASTLAAAQALNAELVARVEVLEKDAARYRHLRGHRGMEHDSFAVHSTLTDDLLWGDDLDHEIDRIAAIAARSGT